jgi:hypothetical protein
LPDTSPRPPTGFCESRKRTGNRKSGLAVLRQHTDKRDLFVALEADRVTATPVFWNQLIPAVDGGYMLPAMPHIVSEIRESWTPNRK